MFTLSPLSIIAEGWLWGWEEERENKTCENSKSEKLFYGNILRNKQDLAQQFSVLGFSSESPRDLKKNYGAQAQPQINETEISGG